MFRNAKTIGENDGVDVFSPQKEPRRFGSARSTNCSGEDFWDTSNETKPQKSFSLVIVDQLFECLSQYSRSHWSGVCKFSFRCGRLEL